MYPCAAGLLSAERCDERQPCDFAPPPGQHGQGALTAQQRRELAARGQHLGLNLQLGTERAQPVLQAPELCGLLRREPFLGRCRRRFVVRRPRGCDEPSSSSPLRCTVPGAMPGSAARPASVAGRCLAASRSVSSARIQPRGRLRRIARDSRQAASARSTTRSAGAMRSAPLNRCHASAGSVVYSEASSSARQSSMSHERRPRASRRAPSSSRSDSRWRTSSAA